VIIQAREFNEAEEITLFERITQTIDEQAYILVAASKINETTVEHIMQNLIDSKTSGETVKDFKDRLVDLQAFDNERISTIARTETGTWSSLGQVTAGKDGGARYKIWMTSGNKTVRQSHKNRDYEKVLIDENFSQQQYSIAPRYPCDPLCAAGDRINCRCGLGFSDN
jgi:uncharacterized protein with gpF-like domain